MGGWMYGGMLAGLGPLRQMILLIITQATSVLCPLGGIWPPTLNAAKPSSGNLKRRGSESPAHTEEVRGRSAAGC